MWTRVQDKIAPACWGFVLKSDGLVFEISLPFVNSQVRPCIHVLKRFKCRQSFGANCNDTFISPRCMTFTFVVIGGTKSYLPLPRKKCFRFETTVVVNSCYAFVLSVCAWTLTGIVNTCTNLGHPLLIRRMSYCGIFVLTHFHSIGTEAVIFMPNTKINSSMGHKHTVRLLTHVLCKPTHFFFHSFIATMSYSPQISFNSVMKDWADKYHAWGTPTRSPSRPNSR